jgi:hypothetical protein
MRSSFIFCVFHYFLSEIRVRWGEILGRNPRLRMQEMAFPRLKIQNFPGGSISSNPIVVWGPGATVKFQNRSTPGAPLLVRAPPPESDDRRPKRQGWQISNINVLISLCFQSLSSGLCDTEIMLSRSNILNDEYTHFPYTVL